MRNNIESFPNPFRVEEEVRRDKSIDFAIKSLKAEWNYPEEFIVKVAYQFECASEGNIFLDFLDGADNMEDAWRRYCEYRRIDGDSVEFHLKQDDLKQNKDE
jgi:hypothetical protein